jgi:hypothetical protein
MRKLDLALACCLAAWLTAAVACASSKPAPPNYAAGDTLLPHRELTVQSRILGEKRRINIYVPPDYDASPERRYPILYMPDGGTKEDFPHLTYTVDGAIKANKIRPIIVVGIENTERRRDLTGPTTVAKDKTIAPVVGGSARFRAFLRDELLPKLRAQLRGNGTTGIIGESLAGLFVVETLVVEPTMFDIYIAIDPTLQWNASHLVAAAPARFAGGAASGRTLYLTAAGTRPADGNAGFVAPLAAALRAQPPNGLRWSYEPRPQQTHGTIYRASKLAILERLFPAN